MTVLDEAYEAWPDQIPPPVIRLRDAIEETYAAAKVLGLDAAALYAQQAPWRLRADAWLWRSSQLLRVRQPGLCAALAPDPLEQLLAGVGS